MKWDRPRSLGKTVEAKETNRPVKIAYLVPFEDDLTTQMILDAVFFESYTRWAGVYTLVLPTEAQKFLAEGYAEWLKHYDPDFVYSYVDLDSAFVNDIDRLCCPVAFLQHKKFNHDNQEVSWRSFVPRWDHYIQPVSSISTVQSPASYPKFPGRERPDEPTVFTQYGLEPVNRFLADNFGTGFSLLNVTHAIPGFLKTLCLVPVGLPENIVAGTERCYSTLEAFSAIADHRVIPISRFAMAESVGIPRPESSNWSYAFRLFIGTAPIDRINFWNSRHLGSSWTETANALILEPAFFEDEQLVKQLGQYLNRHNFLTRNNGPYQAEIHSSSVADDALTFIRDKLRPFTWNAVNLSHSLDALVIASKTDLVERFRSKATNSTTIKLTEDSSEVTASEPSHFIYIPPQLRGIARGQWVIELSIQRQNNLSRYSNVVDTWTLPRRRKIARAFTDRMAKPTFDGRLALVPAIDNFPFGISATNGRSSYEVHLPSDEIFFRHLALEHFKYSSGDLRAAVPRVGYVDLAISDKGQNLRGVISLFDQLPTAFGILTNRFWRTVLAAVKEDATKPLTFDMNKLESFIPNDRETIQRLTQELHFDSVRITKNYLRDSLKDTLEHLVRLNVFYQVARWRCSYCGHWNSRSFDNMRIKNECDICTTEHLAAIDIEWQYELNDFVYRSLQKHSGLPVLWTLGFLQDQLHGGAFWYLPEVDLYEKDDDLEGKNEIDILCMLDGVYHAVEVKLSASVFLNKANSVDKFVKVIGRLCPDVALLAFERYCVEGEDVGAAKAKLEEIAVVIREQIGPWTALKILVAQDIDGFNDFSTDSGWYGHRTRKYH